MGRTLDILERRFEPRVLISVKEAAPVLGMHPATIYRLKPPIPRREVGGRRMIHIADLAEWLDSLKVAVGELEEHGEEPSGRCWSTRDSERLPRKRGRPRKVEPEWR